METSKSLFWYQGAYFQPQHLQQLELSWQSKLIPLTDWMTPHFWGIQTLEIKKAALGVRSFGLVRGQFLFPDGTHVDFPGNAVLEERCFAEGWIDGGKPLPVYLGLKKWNPDGENVTVVQKGDSLSEVSTRFIVGTDPEETRDLHGGGPAAYVKKLTYLLKVFWEPEKDHLGDYLLIPVALLERQGSSIGLSDCFIPPCLSHSGSDTLSHLLKDIQDQLSSRGRQLEDHKRERGIQTAEFGSRDLVYLLALRTINRGLPQFLHLLESHQTHPWPLYGALRQIIGDLSCFSETMSVLGEESEAGTDALPAYDPLKLWDCFSAAQNRILRLLDGITAGPDEVIPMALTDGIYAADLKPSILDGNRRFYIAFTMDHDGKKTAESMDGMVKLSSQDQIDTLISHALPGIPLGFLHTVPQELPRKRNVLYFAVDTKDDQWADVVKERKVALAWDGAPADLHVELMVASR